MGFTIVAKVQEHHGEVSYQADPEALEFFESESLAEESASVASK